MSSWLFDRTLRATMYFVLRSRARYTCRPSRGHAPECDVRTSNSVRGLISDAECRVITNTKEKLDIDIIAIEECDSRIIAL